MDRLENNKKESLLICGSALMYFLSLLPLLMISRYNFPCADDYSMNVASHAAYQAAGGGIAGWFAVIGASLSEVGRFYRTWQGNFTGVFLMTQAPSIYGESRYGIGTWIVLALLTAGTLFLGYVLFRRVLRIQSKLYLCVLFLLLFATVQCMPTREARVQGFFWYNGAVYYMGLYGLALFYVGLLLLLYTGFEASRKKSLVIITVVASLLGFLLGGANYLTALSIVLVSILISELFSVKCFVAKKSADSSLNTTLCLKHSIYLVIPTLCSVIGLLVSMLAPGNSVRSTTLGGLSPIKAILVSFLYSLRYIIDEWMTWPVLLMLAAIAPVCWVLAGDVLRKDCGSSGTSNKGTNTLCSFSHPVIAVILGLGVMSANITAPLYATGNIEAGRIQAIFWAQSLLIIVLLEFYLIGWMRSVLVKARETSNDVESGGAFVQEGSETIGMSSVSIKYIASCAALFIFGSALCVQANPDYYTFTSALQDLRSGAAVQFAAEQKERLIVLQDASVEDAVLSELSVNPDLLFFSDITEDPSEWTNDAMARYYGKRSVMMERGTNE